MGLVHGSGRALWLGLGLFSACGAQAGSDAAGALALCAAGQVTGCKCADGSSPTGGAGCAAAAPMSMPASAGSSAGNGAQVSAGVAGAVATGVSVKPSGSAGAAGSSSVSAAAGSGAAGTLAAANGGGAGAAGSSSVNAAGAGAAGAAASGEVNTAAMACGADGMVGKASNAGGAQGRGNGNVQYQVSASNQILRMQTTLAVPAKPNGDTTLFLWPGLEPIQGSPHYSPIGTGVLQPVLTWGGSCAPGSVQTREGKNWWISAQYVNTLGNEKDHKGCYGGDVMNVEIGDLLDIDMSVKGTIWTQKITNRKTGKSVDFDMDMDMQEQRWAMFEIEMASQSSPSEDTVFTNTVMTFEKPEAKACQPNTRGADDYFSAPVASADGLRCCTDRIVLRVAGAKHTTMDP